MNLTSPESESPRASFVYTPTFSLQYTWTGTWYDIEKCKMCFYVRLPFMLRSRTETLKNGMGYDTESNYWISCGIDTGVVDTGAATTTVLTASTEFRVCWKEKTMQCPHREVDYRNGWQRRGRWVRYQHAGQDSSSSGHHLSLSQCRGVVDRSQATTARRTPPQASPQLNPVVCATADRLSWTEEGKGFVAQD